MRRIWHVGLGVMLVLTCLTGMVNLTTENVRATVVSGDQFDGSGGPWTLAGSPYIVIDNVTVPSDETLTIEPGVEVRFDGFFRIFVEGTLKAIGTETDNIIVTSNKSVPAKGDWDKIEIDNTGHAEIEYCDISFGGSGIYIEQSSDNVIKHSIFTNNSYGINIQRGSNDNTISYNNVSKNGNGIFIYWGSEYNIILHNNVSDNGYGIHLEWSSSNNLITGNNVTNNGRGIFLEVSSAFNIITDNVISYNNNGTLIDGSDNNVVTDNQISNNANGAWLEGADSNIIANNNLSGNGNGIYFTWMASSNTVSNNDISNNNNGIYLYAPSNDNTITNNYISWNTGDAIYFGSLADYHRVYHNNIVSNFNQAADVATGNSWNDTYPSGGNYWSDYGPVCTDNNDGAVTPQVGGGGPDGICDSQYDIDGDSADYYPHTAPIDTAAPTITSLQPPEGAITNDNMTTIGADYSDANGIDTGSVYLNLDGIDVSSSSTVTASGVTYTPMTALSDGIHHVYLKVSDTLGNIATALWHFYVDATPPVVTNMQPSDGKITNDSTPLIGADYSDEHGINVSSVLLEVDGMDVTSFANVMASGVTYTPAVPLSEAIHDVYLEVRDTLGNLANVSWSFEVELTPPSITNIQPPDTSVTVDTTPTISADYSDPSGINTSTVLIMVDGMDVTSSSVVTISNVVYTPASPMSDGDHNVYVEVKDIPGNLANESWLFSIDSDTTPPVVSNEQPPDLSKTNDNMTLISADYSDPSDIDLGSVLLMVDGINVTLSATITSSGVSYMPSIPLSEGIHNVYLEVRDASFSSNLATYSWSFTVETIDVTPPSIFNEQPPDASDTSEHLPTISADFFDLSGINVSTAILEVDGIDVTSIAALNMSGIAYTPTDPLADGLHTVYVEVSDASPAQNLGWKLWSFTVIDITPPAITNKQPPDASITNDNTPAISANYSDPSGIDMSTVVLIIDGLDVTSFATVNLNGLTYTPASALSDALHTITIRVNDTVGNLATTSWSFTVDITYDPTPPSINNLRPQDGTTTNDGTPTISAEYSDASGIDINCVVLIVDGKTVTSSATITASDISFTPGTELTDGTHTVFLEVCDDSINKNKANVTWSFTVHATEGEEPRPPQPEGGFLSDYWWLLLIIVIVIVLLIVLFIIMRKKKKAKGLTALPQEEDAPPS